MRTLIKPTRTGGRMITYGEIAGDSSGSHCNKARTRYNAPVAPWGLILILPIIGTPHQTQTAPPKLGYKYVGSTTIVTVVIMRPPTRISQRKARSRTGSPHHKHIPTPIYRYTGSIIQHIPPEIRAPHQTQIAPRKLGYKCVMITTIVTVVIIRPPTRISQRKIRTAGRPHHKHIPTPIYRYTVRPIPPIPPKYVLHTKLRLLPENLAINAS
jgi:hypothetical protein